MTRIPTYIAQQTLAPVSFPRQSGESPLGQAVGNLGAAFDALGRRKAALDEQRDALSARANYDALQEDISQGYTELKRDAPVDGRDLASSAIEKVMEPRWQKFRTSLPPDIQEKYDLIWKADSTKLRNAFANDEYNLGKAYSIGQMAEFAKRAENTIGAESDQFDAMKKEFAERVNEAPFLSKAERAELIQKAEDRLSKAAAVSLGEHLTSFAQAALDTPGDPLENVKYIESRINAAEKAGLLDHATAENWRRIRTGKYAADFYQTNPDKAVQDLSPSVADTAARVSSRDPRGIRNNNPGNIEFGKFARARGATGSDGRFAQFKTPEDGIAAMHSLLASYQRKGLTTIRGMIGRWAPSSENDTSAYVSSVSGKVGIDPDKPFNFAGSPDLAKRMIGAMIQHENGKQPFTDSQLAAGVRNANDTGTRPEGVAGESDATPSLANFVPADQRPALFRTANQLVRNREETGKDIIKSLMADDLVSIRETGEPTEINEIQVRTVLGNGAATLFLQSRQEASLFHSYTASMPALPLDRIDALVEQSKPQQGPAFASGKRVHDDVVKFAEEVIEERAKAPAAAAMRQPAVKAAFDAVARLQQQPVPGPDVAGATPDTPRDLPTSTRAAVRAMMNAQRDFGLPRKAIALIPDNWARQIGRAFLEFPDEITRENRDMVAQTIGLVYDGLHEQFGDMTGDIIRYSLAHTEALKKGTKSEPAMLEEVIGMLRLKEQGKPMTAAERARLREINQAPESEGGGFWSSMWGGLFGNDASKTNGASPTNDEMSRLLTAGDDEERQDIRTDLIDLYGEDAVRSTERRFEEMAQ